MADGSLAEEGRGARRVGRPWCYWLYEFDATALPRSWSPSSRGAPPRLLMSISSSSHPRGVRWWRRGRPDPIRPRSDQRSSRGRDGWRPARTDRPLD